MGVSDAELASHAAGRAVCCTVPGGFTGHKGQLQDLIAEVEPHHVAYDGHRADLVQTHAADPLQHLVDGQTHLWPIWRLEKKKHNNSFKNLIEMKIEAPDRAVRQGRQMPPAKKKKREMDWKLIKDQFFSVQCSDKQDRS